MEHDSELAKITYRNLEAGDDAAKAEWTPVTPDLIKNMYANHAEILLKSTVVQDYLNSLEPKTPATP